MRRLGTISIFLILLATPVSAEEFSAVVKSIESHHGMRHTSPHLIGLAAAIANPVLWDSEADRFQVSSFENGDVATKFTLQQLDRIFQTSLGSFWQPFLQVDSRKSGRATSIYANITGSSMRLLIGSIEGNAIGVVQMELDAKAIARIMTGLKGGAPASVHWKRAF